MTDDLDPSGGCRFRILTAPGPGAVAVVELTCDLPKTAQWILRRISSSSGQTPGMSPGRICYGRWNDEDLVVVRTSIRTWEIQCHGGTVAVNRIRGDLLNDGATEFVRRLVGCGPALGSVPGAETEHFGKIGDESGRVSSESVRSMVQQEIQSRVANARSRRTAGLLLAQASSSLCHDLMMILDSQHRMTAEATAVRQRLADWQNVADHLTEPWRVVFAGAPNVGKSSLMNVIAGMERSIVCDQPGTTRDVVEVDGVIDGWPFRFVDTAGLRKDSADQIEKLGIEQSHRAASQCDVLCLVFDDDSGNAAWSDRLALAVLPKHAVLVRNKCDLITEHDFDQPQFRDSPRLSGLPVIKVSARTGHGVPELLQWIKQCVVPHEPRKDTALPICGL